MKTIALLDADVFAYKAAAAVETSIEWEDELWTTHANMAEARDQVDTHIEDVVLELKASKVIVALSCPTRRYWRHDIYPAYKGNRKNQRAPLLLTQVKEYLADRYESFVRPGLEADDTLGILSTHPSLGGRGRKVIVSTDKDFKTIPGYFHDLGKEETFLITEEEADYNHLYQTLIGDATDGYPGCPKVGPVTAKKLLKPVEGQGVLPMWEVVLGAYRKAKLEREDALKMARVARICRQEDYDFERKEVKLWKPTQNCYRVSRT